MSQLGKTEQSKLFDSKMQPPINNHRYVDKNIHETIERIQSYEIHQKKLIRLKEDLEKKKTKKVNADTSYEHLKSQMINNKLRSHEFTETEKINEIKRSNQKLLEKLLDISKGKRCDVKQENISAILPQSKSLNYQVKKKEAERIDSENQKIMERIVNQNASLSSKKMHQDYMETIKYKKMKDQKMGLSVEKILERKRKMVLDARSTILPLLQTKQNSPGGPDCQGRNYTVIGGDSQSQRLQNANYDEQGINIANQHTEYLNTNQNSNNRYGNKTQLAKLSHSATPKSQRQKRILARSELSDYRDPQPGGNFQSQTYKRPNKIVLESITQKSTVLKNAKINHSVLQTTSGGKPLNNKPPVAPLITNQNKVIPKGSSKNYNNDNNGQSNANTHSSTVTHSTKNGQKQAIDLSLSSAKKTTKGNNYNTVQVDNQQNKQLPFQQIPLNIVKTEQMQNNTNTQEQNLTSKRSVTVDDDIINEDEMEDTQVNEINQKKLQQKQHQDQKVEPIVDNDDVEEDYEEDFVGSPKQQDTGKQNIQQQQNKPISKMQSIPKLDTIIETNSGSHNNLVKQQTQLLNKQQTVKQSNNNAAKNYINQTLSSVQKQPESFIGEESKFYDRNSIMSDDYGDDDNQAKQNVQDADDIQDEIDNDVNTPQKDNVGIIKQVSNTNDALDDDEEEEEYEEDQFDDDN